MNECLKSLQIQDILYNKEFDARIYYKDQCIEFEPSDILHFHDTYLEINNQKFYFYNIDAIEEVVHYV